MYMYIYIYIYIYIERERERERESEREREIERFSPISNRETHVSLTYEPLHNLQMVRFPYQFPECNVFSE